jgi:hypothetical protein
LVTTSRILICFFLVGVVTIVLGFTIQVSGDSVFAWTWALSPLIGLTLVLNSSNLFAILKEKTWFIPNVVRIPRVIVYTGLATSDIGLILLVSNEVYPWTTIASVSIFYLLGSIIPFIVIMFSFGRAGEIFRESYKISRRSENNSDYE